MWGEIKISNCINCGKFIPNGNICFKCSKNHIIVEKIRQDHFGIIMIRSDNQMLF